MVKDIENPVFFVKAEMGANTLTFLVHLDFHSPVQPIWLIFNRYYALLLINVPGLM